MDMPYFREENQSLSGSNYIETHPNVVIPFLTIISVAMVTGTVGNILVICAVFLKKELRSVGNLFIVNLAVADLCVTAFVNPFSIVGIVQGSMWFENRSSLCEVIACICLTSCFCSLLTIGAIAVNRYIQICHFHIYNKVYTLRNTIVMCAGLWVFSFLAELPNFLGWGDHAYDKKTLSCVWDRTADLSYTIFFSVVGVGLPITLISICYTLIYKHLLTAQSRMKLLKAANQILPNKDTDIEKQSKQMTRMVFISFIAFALCWLPYAFIVALDHKDTFPLEAHFYAILIAHFSSSINNVIYGICNDTFRHAYLHLLGLRRCIPTPQGGNVKTAEMNGTTASEPLVEGDPPTADRATHKI